MSLLVAPACFSTKFADRETGAGGADGSGGTDEDPTRTLCDITLEKPKLALFFLAERSDDMKAVFGGETEGEAQYKALQTFFGDEANRGITVAGTLWPAEDGDYCAPATYSGELEATSVLPKSPGFVGRLQLDLPSGTPDSQGALESAHMAAAAYASEHPDTISEVVFLVSSFGGSCGNQTVDKVAAQLEAAERNGVRTWVVAGQALGSDELTLLAEAGGATKLSSRRDIALEKLPEAVKACQYLLAGGAENPRLGEDKLVLIADQAQCSTGETNEYFVNAYGRLELCPDTCAAAGLRSVAAQTTECPPK